MLESTCDCVSFALDKLHVQISILWRNLCGKVAIFLHGFEANVLGYTLEQVWSSGTQDNSRKGDINIHVLPEFTSVLEFSM